VPEGDTIFRAARTLERALAGQRVSKFDTRLSQLAVVDLRAPIAGRTVTDVSARGKHLLIHFSNDLALRTHMRMHGSWHIYRPGERWRARPDEARIVITTAEWVAIAFNVTDAEFLTAAQIARHRQLSRLGPDLLSRAFDASEVRRRLREMPARHIAEALLRQQAMAGLGNVYKSEVLFLCGMYPFAPVTALDDQALDCLIQRARELMQLNVRDGTVVDSGGRNTTGRLNPAERQWVYGRDGEPCLKCGATILTKAEIDGRRTYWCPHCQPA
jgi:endonuclease-8